jgi:hypothetical protein
MLGIGVVIATHVCGCGGNDDNTVTSNTASGGTGNAGSSAKELGGSAGAAGGASSSSVPTDSRVNDSPATNGVFDAAPMSDSAGNLWMSYSAVSTSPHSASLTEVRTRIAQSLDNGLTWRDVGVDPNGIDDADLQVPLAGGVVWAAWHFEVSSLLYDAADPDATKRWKLLWHRLLGLNVANITSNAIEQGWIGLSTAPSPQGPWSAERKLFTGSLYDEAAVDSFIGAPEFPLSRLASGTNQLDGCLAFTEPSMAARPDGIYVALQCASSPEKIVSLRCDRAFSTCDYVGDWLLASAAAQFSRSGESLNGFAAPELVSVNGVDYLIATPYEQQPAPDTYRGCLVFGIDSWSTASLSSNAGQPTVLKRIYGSAGSFNGACGYDPRATASGVLYNEFSAATPQFHLFASHVVLP